MTQTVLILGGTGKIGAHASEAFWNAGWTVRQFDRARDDMMQAAQGADVIVNGLNPPNYHNWAKIVPTITKQVIAAAKASGATVIIPGNVYNFSDTPGIWGQNTPHDPHTRKGRIRVEMEQAYRASGVQTIVLRAGHLIDPHQNGDIFSMLIMRNAASGKIATLGDPTAKQAYAYLPDWAHAALRLAEKRGDLSAFEDIPFPGRSFSITELRDQVAGCIGRDIKITRFPWWFMTLTSPFWELAREMREMRYLYSTTHQLDGARLRALLPDFRATDMGTIIRAGLPRDINPNQVMQTGQQPIIAE